MSRVSSYTDCRKGGKAELSTTQESPTNLFHIIQQIAAAENALWNILDGLKANTTHSSFFCREYWGCSCSQAQLSLERLLCNERLKRQVQQACVLESLSLGVASHLCSGVMQGISVTIRSRLRNLLYYIHENCLVLLDMVCQRWMMENQQEIKEPQHHPGHKPENLNLDILVRVKRYRRLRRGEHVMALRQHNEMIVNVVRQLCRGAGPKRPPLSSRGAGDRSPGGRSSGLSRTGSQLGSQTNVLTVVNDVLTARGTPLDRLKVSTIRNKMLQYMTFRPLLNVDGADPDSPWPMEDPYLRYGVEQFAPDAPIIWFEPLPPMLPNLEEDPKLPPSSNPEVYTLVLDLDETLVHYFEHDGMGNYDIRPGMHEFLERMNQLGYELVIFTAATQDYADWVIDQIDPNKLIHHRLYRQHALPWGPIFVKDMSRLGRDLDRTLIIDNVQENFMLQPSNGIFIFTWYDDPHDTALFALTPLLDELIATRAKVPEILDKYRDQIPTWAGFDQYSQLGGEYSEYDIVGEDGLAHDQGVGYPVGQETVLQPQSHYPCAHQAGSPVNQWEMELQAQPQMDQWERDVQVAQPPYIPAVDSYGTSPAATASYAGRYQQAPAPAQISQQVQYAPQPCTTQQKHQPAMLAPPPRTQPHHQVQARPASQQEVQGLTRPAPAFSGVAGPHQAPQQQPQQAPQQQIRGNLVASPAWSRTGAGGPYQAVRHR